MACLTSTARCSSAKCGYLVPPLTPAPNVSKWHGPDAVVLVASPQVRGWKWLAMFPNESNRTERQFWSALAFRVCREMQNHPICKQRRLWCDGFIPEHYLLDREPRCITGVAWMGMGGRHQEEWKFSLILPLAASGRADIIWSDLTPGSETDGWLVIAPEKKKIEVRLSP